MTQSEMNGLFSWFHFFAARSLSAVVSLSVSPVDVGSGGANFK